MAHRAPPSRLGPEVMESVALGAEIDQLRSAVREALHLCNVRGLGVPCESCGAKVGRSCYGNGPMARPHDARTHAAEEQARQILRDALGSD